MNANATRTQVSAADLARLDARAEALGVPLQRDARMAPFTTLRVGGPADRLATPRDRKGLLAALRLGREAGVPTMVIGNGSDLVVADAGIRGFVIRNRANGVVLRDDGLSADSGAPMALLVKRCAAAGLAGFEFGISIPGTLGGAVWANAGAHGGEMAQIVTAVEAWDPRDDAVRQFDGGACRFGYRDSRFKHGPEVVLSATLRLRRDDPATIAARVAGHQAQRRATQPLAEQNAGSVFRNPAGDHAGRLIDAAGLKRMRVGSASVSNLHANFIITDRAGRAEDVRRLGDQVRAAVRDRFGVELEYEIEFIGDWPPGEREPAS